MQANTAGNESENFVGILEVVGANPQQCYNRIRAINERVIKRLQCSLLNFIMLLDEIRTLEREWRYLVTGSVIWDRTLYLQ